MIKLIREAYNEISELLYKTELVTYYFRRDNYDKALRISRTMIESISSFLNHVISEDTYLKNYIVETQENFHMMFENIMFAQQTKDYILLADLYQLQFMNWLKGMQELIVSNEEIVLNHSVLEGNLNSIAAKNLELKQLLEKCTYEIIRNNGYELEFTSTGELTLLRTKKEKQFYFHSNVSPKWEGFLLADAWFDTEKDHYFIYGMGLGYAVLELLKYNQFIEVTVIESDINILYSACLVNDFSQYINNNRLKIVYDPKFHKINNYLSNIKEDEIFLVHAPSMVNIDNVDIREVIETYFLQYHSMKNQYELLKGNFNKSIKRKDDSIEKLERQFKDKTVYIIAAGPSLDKNFELLKNVKDGIILATGTVFKKLLRAGIEPDFLIVSDANPRVYAQIEGVEDKNVPMIYLSTANYQFANRYMGKKYIAFQYGFELAEQYAQKYNHMLIKTGGSVTTTALDISISLGCRKVVFLGLDLGYPNGYVHAEGTSRRKLVEENNLRTLQDINGELIKTSNSLLIYKKWIEDCIQRSIGVEFIDATEGGARIEGAKQRKLRDMIKG